MSKYDIYLQENSNVLKNLLNITDEDELDLAEAELSRAKMMLMYKSGFSDFSTNISDLLFSIYIHSFLILSLSKKKRKSNILLITRRKIYKILQFKTHYTVYKNITIIYFNTFLVISFYLH